MATLEQTIDQIADSALRQLIQEEVRQLKSDKKFGLVFEGHLPEVVPIYSAAIKKGTRVAPRSGPMTPTWRVLSIKNGLVLAVSDSDGLQREFAREDLVVVKRFGEAIYPTLIPVDRVDRAPNKSCHVLIESDNYHALQLLDYLYAGMVDCIYIDPPYNTGARDWKYNNDYVDANDSYRHSKWLSMMKKRLTLAFRLLKPTGIMVITIDDYELPHLRVLLEDSAFNDIVDLGVVCIRNNPGGRATANGVAVNHEYAIFLGRTSEAKIGRLERTAEQLARYNLRDDKGPFEWANFRKHGADSDKEDRPRQFYPIYTKGHNIRIPAMTWDSDTREWINIEPPGEEEVEVWPINEERKLKVWGWGVERVKENISEFKSKIKKDGSIQIYKKERVPVDEGMLPGTWWDKTQYSSNESGTKLLQKIFEGEDREFPFPKSLYAVIDTLKAAGVGNNPNALVVDFFAGSGTTFHALCLMNAVDGGNRRSIIVTNNEVSPAERAEALLVQGYKQGSPEFEQQGICQFITFPRCKYVLNGHRGNGTTLPGTYLTGRKIQCEKARAVRPLPFASSEQLDKVKHRKALAAVVGFKQSKVDDGAWYLHEGEVISVLWNPKEIDAYCEALKQAGEEVETVLVALPDNRDFREARSRILAALPPIYKYEDEVRPLADGFDENLQYFRLDFLDPLNVELGRELSQLVPILWTMSGSKGSLPKVNGSEPYLIPEAAPFSILIQETRFAEFRERLAGREDISHVFIVTDNVDSFHTMKEEIGHQRVIQLYSNYLNNFRINTDERAL